MSSLFHITLVMSCLLPAFSRSQARIQSVLANSSLFSGTPPVPKTHTLKGAVKQITQVQSPLTNKKTDWFDGHSGQNYSEEYTKQGYLQKHISHNDYNEPQSFIHYEYNSAGQISTVREETLVDNPLSGRTEGRIDYEFDRLKKLYIIHDKRVMRGKLQNRRIETSIDSVERKMVQQEFSQDTVLIREQLHKWDRQGYITEQASRYRKQREEPDRAGFEHFARNELGLTFSEQEKKAMQKSLDSLIYKQDSLHRIQPEWTGDTVIYKNEYDSQARLISQESYRKNQLTETLSFTYTPEATRVVRQSYNRHKELTYETISLQHRTEHYILSDTNRFKNGDVWESKTYNWQDYPKASYQYKYDKHGNWIEQKQVDNTGKQMGVTLVRKIDYYP